MTVKQHVLFTIAFLCALQLPAGERLLNANWEFQRLDDKTAVPIVVHNQGSGWDSQFNVSHVSAGGALAVSPDILAEERKQLARGTWENVRLPHTPRVEPLVVREQWQGICYYHRSLDISAREAVGRLWIEMEGAMCVADLWVNDRHVSQHAGGFTPFVVDLTGLLHKGTNSLTVRLDNRDQPLVPPGKPLAELDFSTYGGLYRDVRLLTRPTLYITHPELSGTVGGGGVFVTYPEVDDSHAKVQVQTEVENRTGGMVHFTLRQKLLDGNKCLSQSEQLVTLQADKKGTFTEQMGLDNPKLWSPDSPHLYDLQTEVIAKGLTSDKRITRIGIRRLDVTAEKGLLVNGRPLRLNGCNRHQEYPYVGYALSDNAQRRDMWQIKQNGFNVVRLGHYPQDPSVLEACDELGLLVIEPIPGWQYFNRDTTFVNLTMRDTRSLIRRDRNHPCMLLYETTLNESWPPKEWKDQVVATAHAETPEGLCLTSGDSYGYSGFDVCYNDWQDGYRRPATTPKPAFIREYYDYEFGGHYSTTRVGRKDGERALLVNARNAQWSLNRYAPLYPHTIGGAVWSMYDYNRGCCDNICESGVADIFRLPKYSLAFYRSQLDAGTPLPGGKMPYELFAATQWTSASPVPLLVYGNVEEVEVRIGGKTVARQKPDNGPDSEYSPRIDGGNCSYLRHAPFTFNSVKWQPQPLELIGYAGGHRVASVTVKTPGTPVKLALSYFESGTPASRHDVLLVYAILRDAAGTLCPVNGSLIHLEADGGTVVGPDSFATESGVATFVVQTGSSSALRLKATGKGMSAKTRIRLKHARENKIADE